MYTKSFCKHAGKYTYIQNISIMKEVRGKKLIKLWPIIFGHNAYVLFAWNFAGGFLLKRECKARNRSHLVQFTQMH